MARLSSEHVRVYPRPSTMPHSDHSVPDHLTDPVGSSVPASRSSPSLDVLEQAARWKAEGKAVALATVVSTWGSSPRPAGSQLAVTGDSAFVGSVSGGCIESAVVQEALEVLADGKSRVLEFGVSNETAWDVGLACGGKIRVFVERIE